MVFDRIRKGIAGFTGLVVKEFVDIARTTAARIEIHVDGKRIREEEEDNMELYENAQTVEPIWYLPDNVSDVQFSDDASPKEIGMLIASAQSTQPEDEIDDRWMEYISEYPALPAPKVIPALPENLQRGYYPQTIKPNIDAIKQWVINVKLAGASNEDIIEEYYRDRETPNRIKDPNWTRRSDSITKNDNNIYRIKESVVDSIAYKVARKIWYVGRRPASMTDGQWDEHTKYRRPEEGSFGKNDTWEVFKYDVNYKYESGVDEDI